MAVPGGVFTASPGGPWSRPVPPPAELEEVAAGLPGTRAVLFGAVIPQRLDSGWYLLPELGSGCLERWTVIAPYQLNKTGL